MPFDKNLFISRFRLGLTDTGELIEVCPFTQKMFRSNKEWDKTIEDLIVLEATDDYVELLTLSKSKDSNERVMDIIEFPSRALKYELTIPEVAWLVTQPKSSMNMYFIAGEKNSSNFIQTVEMKSISETDPAQRLKKLILKGYLDEAEVNFRFLFLKTFTDFVLPHSIHRNTQKTLI